MGSRRLCMKFRRLMSLAVVIICAGCSIPVTPKPKLNHTSLKKFPLEVAVIFSNEFRNCTFETTDVDVEGTVIIKIGQASYQAFHDNLNILFKKVDFYDTDSMPKKKYSLYLVPELVSFNASRTKYTDGSRTVYSNISYSVKVLDYDQIPIANIHADSKGTYDSGDKVLAMLPFLTPWTIWFALSAKDYFVARDYSKSFDESISVALSSLIHNLHKSNEINEYLPKAFAYAQSEKEKREKPSQIELTVYFSDTTSIIPDNTIDAGEQSTITATITNNGKGTAFDVNLSAESQYKNLVFPKTISVGDIQPGESKDLTIPIKADLFLTTGTASFLVKTHEKRGYDARPAELQIPTAKLRSPRLLFASCNLNDSSGLASGDGDGIAENNETIELNPYVNNDGVGDALKVSIKLTDVTQGIEIIKGSDQLTSIAPGTIGKATLAFKIPRTFSQPEIKYIIAATDVRGMETEKTYTIPFQSKTPILYYTYQVVDTRNREIPGMENGKSYSLKITPKNTGSNIAEGVNVRVNPESSKVIVGSYDGNVGVLQPDSPGPVITAPISLDRSFVDPSMSINIAMTQESFPGLSRDITLPVMVKKPNLEYRVVLLNGISDKELSQNSWPRFRVSISNNGNLDARDVRIRFYMSDVGITFDKEEMIGTIMAGESQYKDFTFFVRGDAPVGKMPVKVRITQADFDDISTTIAYRLTKQTAIVQRVEATGSGSGRYASATYSGPPELYINSPNKDTETYKQTTDLHGSIMTFGPGNAVQNLSISLNNEPLKIISVAEDIRFDANQITRRPVEDNKTIFDGAIFLRPGINVVKIACTDRNGQKSEQTVTIIKKAKLGNIYAVVVGISKFHNPGYNLKYAASDAMKFYDFLRSESGGQLPENRVRLLADSSAMRANVIGTLTNLLGKSTKEDTVEIYFATHGITDFDGTLYYLCYDTEIENLRGTGFSDRDLTDILNKNIAAGKIIIYLDACHSGLSGLSERYAKRSIVVYEVNERINSLAGALSKTAATGVVCFSASSSTGYSLEDPKWNGGVFTHCLVNGLQGEANGNNDEWVSVNELDNYLVRKVMALTEGKQRPKVNGTLMGDTPLSKIR
jgi:uncharacterized caspase-like protein